MTSSPDSRAILAVDFGTFNTVAVISRNGRPPEPLLVDGSPAIPSTVLATPDGRLLVGRDAQRAAASDPASCEPNPKRRIDETTILLGHTEYPTAQLIGAVLQRVAEVARAAIGANPTEYVLTYPAAWGAPRRDVLLKAAGEAGWAWMPRLVPEPVAAARHFLADDRESLADGEAALVYDLGAGTCDLTVVARRGRNMDVVAVDGLNDVGGLDIDHLIIEQLRRSHPAPEAWQRLTAPTTANDRRQRRTLWEDARSSKELLSRENLASLYIPLLNVDTHITRDELQEWAQPLLRSTSQVAGKLIRTAAEQGATVSKMYLTGGGARIPLAATELLRETNLKPTLTEQPELVIASGAVLAGHDTSAPAPVPQPVSPAVPAASAPVSPPVPAASAPASPPASQSPPSDQHDPAATQEIPPQEAPAKRRGLSRRGLIIGGLVGLGVAAAATTGAVLLWRDSVQPLNAKGHVTALTFSADGKTLANSGKNGKVELWKASKGERIHTVNVDVPVRAMASVPDSDRFAAATEVGVVIVDLSLETQKEVTVEGDFPAIAVSRDGKKVFGSGATIDGSKEDGIAVVDIEGGSASFVAGANETKNLAVTRDEKFLYTAGGEGIHQFGLESTEDAPTFRTDPANWVAVSPDDKLVAGAADDGAFLWDASDGKKVATIGNKKTHMVAFNPGGDTVATAGEGGVQLWDTITGERTDSLYDASAQQIAFSSDGAFLASSGAGSSDTIISLWSL